LLSHGFVRAADGTITTFVAPGAGTTGAAGTFPTSINAAGTIAGYYMNLDRAHGFVRSTDGTVTTIDPPGDVDGTYAESINTQGGPS
jgi:hypothetical protein